MAVWMIWLRLHLLGLEPGPAAWLEGIGVRAERLGALAAVLIVACGALVIRGGGRLFLLIIAGAFGYLSLQAIRNMNLLGLAAGCVLSWNVGAWAVEIARVRAGTEERVGSSHLAGLAARTLVAAAIVFVMFTVVTGRFFRATGEPQRFGLREAPLLFAARCSTVCRPTGPA